MPRNSGLHLKKNPFFAPFALLTPLNRPSRLPKNSPAKGQRAVYEIFGVDRERLRQSLFEQKVKAQKLRRMIKSGEPSAPLDTIVVASSEYADYLEQAYDDDLRELASQRAMVAKEWIVKTGRVAPERIFLVEPRSLNPESVKDTKNSRVDFTLR